MNESDMKQIKDNTSVSLWVSMSTSSDKIGKKNKQKTGCDINMASINALIKSKAEKKVHSSLAFYAVNLGSSKLSKQPANSKYTFPF